MPNPLATTDDLEVRLGRSLTGVEIARAAAVLDDVSALIRAYTGQTFTIVTTTERIWPRNGQARLTQAPVVDVTTVKNIAGNDLAFTWYDGPRVTLGANQINWFEVNGTTAQPVDVTYEHGYDNVPGDIVAVVCQIAGRTMTRPSDQSGLQQESIAGYSYSLGSAAAAGAAGLLADERAALDRYRIVGGSIRMAAGFP